MTQTLEKLIMVHGFEVPGDTCHTARKILKQLAENHVVKYTHDGGHGVLVHREIKEIADKLGIEYHETNYEIVLWDNPPIVDGLAWRDIEYIEKKYF